MVQDSTSFILPSVEATVELSPLDNFITTFACIPWTVFYRNDLSGEKLKTALEKIAVAYPVVCGRLKKHPERRLEIAISPSAGFSYTEAYSDKTLKEAIVEARISDQTATFPSFAQLPFCAEHMVTPMMIDQDAPLLMVKLMHYANGGCSLAVTIHHTVADGQRLAEFICAIATAYQGKEVRAVNLERSRTWPDQLLEKVPLGMDPKDFPREFKLPFDTMPLPTFPDETYAMETVYFPVDELKALKKKMSAELKDVEFISQIDVVTALLWMVRCELAVVREGRSEPVKTAGDLAIHDTHCVFFFDLVANGSFFFPEDFFGCAFFGTLAHCPEATSEEAKEKDLLHTAVEVATVIRKHIIMMRQPAAQAMTCIEMYKAMSELPPYPSLIAGLSSFAGMPFDKMDFGDGPPIHNFCLPSYPFGDVWGNICRMADGKGLMINHVVRSRDRQPTIDSTVLKELLPGSFMLSDKKPDEIAKLIGLED